jgi:hypothetical protein
LFFLKHNLKVAFPRYARDSKAITQLPISS